MQQLQLQSIYNLIDTPDATGPSAIAKVYISENGIAQKEKTNQDKLNDWPSSLFNFWIQINKDGLKYVIFILHFNWQSTINFIVF